jgi:hypothetical protein
MKQIDEVIDARGGLADELKFSWLDYTNLPSTTGLRPQILSTQLEILDNHEFLTNLNSKQDCRSRFAPSQ